MLTDDEKARLRAEEAFKYSIREEIEKENAKPKTFFRRLEDSKLAIWGITGLLAGLAGILAPKVLSLIDSRVSNADRRKEIALEIDRRFVIYAPYINVYLNPRDNFQVRLVDEVKGTLKHLFSRNREEYKYVLPKWREYSLDQLYGELSALNPDDKALTAAVAHAGEFSARVTIDKGALALNFTGRMWVGGFCSHWKTHQPYLGDRVSAIRYDWGSEPAKIANICDLANAATTPRK